MGKGFGGSGILSDAMYLTAGDKVTLDCIKNLWQ